MIPVLFFFLCRCCFFDDVFLELVGEQVFVFLLLLALISRVLVLVSWPNERLLGIECEVCRDEERLLMKLSRAWRVIDGSEKGSKQPGDPVPR